MDKIFQWVGLGATALLASTVQAQEFTPDFAGNVWIEQSHCVVGAGGLQLEGNADADDLYDYMTALAGNRAATVREFAASKALKRFGRRGSKQVVYLEFNPGEDPTFPVAVVDASGALLGFFFVPDYVYSQEDKDFIQARLEETYALYNYEFTQVQPASGDFSTLSFGDNDQPNITFNNDTGGINILFGRAENIDFRNKNMADNAFIDASVWAFLLALDPSGGALSALSGLPIADASETGAVLQQAVRTQSANTGAHELGHIQGLRHHDSIGAPGFGLPIGVDPLAYLPVGETEQNADETLLHTMASGASVGLPLQNSTTIDRFFGERSAAKLALNPVADRRAIAERRSRGRLFLTPLLTANPVEEGVNANSRFLRNWSSLIEGRLDEPGEVDGYQFFGFRGSVFNAEIVSFSDAAFDEPIIGLLVLSKLERGGVKTEVARNRLTFEGVEPMIIDFELPSTGRYVLEVSSPADIDFGGGNVFPLSDFGLGGFEVGDYDLHTYFVSGR